MPRQMPRIDTTLKSQAQSAIGIVRAGETMRAVGGIIGRQEWSLTRVEALYELAFLRVFATYELCLEEILCRTLCGYVSRAGKETLHTGTYYPTLSSAETAILGGQAYKLWHDPAKVISRCNGFIKSGAPLYPAQQASVLSSNLSRLTDLAYVRHRIVHEQKDAKRKFDSATVNMAGHTYPASRPGKFLRDISVSGASWLETSVNELANLVAQMV